MTPTNNAGGPYNDEQAKHTRPEHDPRRFHGPYIVDESTGDDWYDKFFARECPRGFAKVLDNVDSEGKPLGQTVLFRCPCPHAETMNLPINRTDEHPSWGFSKAENGYMTLNPSIQNHADTAPNGKHICCDSHFFIRNGMVEWC